MTFWREALRRSPAGMALLVIMATAVLAASGSVAHAEPTPAQIEQQITEAWTSLEPVIEQYNQVHAQLTADQAKAGQLRRQLDPLRQQVDAAMAQVGAIAAAAYKRQRASTLDALLGARPDTLADRLTALNWIAKDQRAQVSAAAALRGQLEEQQRAVDRAVADLAPKDAALAAQRKAIEAKIAGLQQLRRQAGAVSTTGLRTGPCPVDFLPGPGGQAAQKACSLIGKPYIWGAAGPAGYDCSGLTMAAWAAAGVALRHYTQWQWQDGRPISRAELQPGDLVFFYSDLHHMGIYVGGNTMVHAPRTGDYVRMAPMDRGMPIAGYRRVRT